MKNRFLLMVTLAWALAAHAQAPIEQVDISADQLLSGSADQQLQALGKRAAADHLGITVTAPAYWRAQIEKSIKSGAGSGQFSIKFRETMIESVIVRLVSTGSDTDKKAAKVDSGPVGPAPELPMIETGGMDNAASALKTQARAAINNQSDPVMAAPAPKFESIITPLAAPQMSMGDTAFESSEPEDANVEQQPEMTAPAVVGKVVEAPAEAPEAISTETAEPDQAIAQQQLAETAREGLERRINKGREIKKSLKVSQLRRGDQLFKTGDLIAVVRLSGAGRNTFWLNGQLDLEQQAIRRIQSGKYEVMRRVEGLDGETIVTAPEPDQLVASALDLDQAMDERTEMEAWYNQGNRLESSISVAGLRQGDILYVGETLKMVVRRERVSIKRFWLEGELDLQRAELEKVGKLKYRVKRNIR